MTARKETYNQAMDKLEKLVAQIENNELDIDLLGDKLKEAKELIKFCKERLYKTDEDIKKILRQTEEDNLQE
ncbi:MAG: exodeoxyribonuclease VII small subunit [Bacteroides sp.]